MTAATPAKRRSPAKPKPEVVPEEQTIEEGGSGAQVGQAPTQGGDSPAPVVPITEPEEVSDSTYAGQTDKGFRYAVSEHFSVAESEKNGLKLVSVAKVGEVGPAPLTLVANQFDELIDILKKLKAVKVVEPKE